MNDTSSRHSSHQLGILQPERRIVGLSPSGFIGGVICDSMLLGESQTIANSHNRLQVLINESIKIWV